MNVPRYTFILAEKLPRPRDSMVQVLPPGASKGAGVARLLKDLGLQPEQLMAIGDGENDVEMLQVRLTLPGCRCMFSKWLFVSLVMSPEDISHVMLLCLEVNCAIVKASGCFGSLSRYKGCDCYDR